MLEMLVNWLWWACEYALCCYHYQCLLTVCNYYICSTQGEQLHTQQPAILLYDTYVRTHPNVSGFKKSSHYCILLQL